MHSEFRESLRPTTGALRLVCGSAALCTLFLCANCLADSPTIKQALPSALAPGKLTQVTFVGSDLAGVTSLWTSFEAKVEKARSDADRAVFNITVPATASTGVGAVRLAATNGISSLYLLMIDRLPSIVENGTNRSIATAQLLKMPVAVDGGCDEKASDFFKFPARKGERISFEVMAQRLGSSLDPLARLLDASGHELIFCEDTPGAGVDCRFSFRFPSSGQYVLELRDTGYDGGSAYRYRLRIGDFPLEPAPLPFVTKSQFQKMVSVLPQVAEVEPNDLNPQKISIPAVINGRFAKTKDRDCFEFEAKKGEQLVFHGKTRSLGSPCDLYLRLESAAGKKVAESPMTGADESSLTNNFKEAGVFRLVVEEAAQLGGPEYFYRLEISPFQPGFAVSVDTDRFQAAPGGSVEIKVLPERRDYDGPITLTLEGAGDGFELATNAVTSKTNATSVKMTLPADLEPGQLVNFRMTGHATIGGKDFTAGVSTRPAWRKLFPHIPWPPAEMDGWMAVGAAAK